MALLNALNIQFTSNNLIYASGANTLAGLTNGNNGVLITSAGGVPSISSTLPIAVQTNITELGTITVGTWNGSLITGTYGGTGVNNGAKTITLGGNLTTSGAFNSTFTMTGNTGVTFPTSGTLATVAGTISAINGTALQIDVNTVAGVATVSIDAGYVGQTSITTLGTIGTGIWAGTNVALNHGGTNAALVASNGGIIYSTATAMAVLAGTATPAQILMSGSSAAPNWSTATYPINATINGIMYGVGAAQYGQLATANNGVLTTGATGIPVITALATDGQVIIGSSAGAPAAATLTAGPGVTITNGHNTITIAAAGSGGTVTSVTGSGNIASSGGNTPNITFTGQLPLANGGTNANLTASNGGIFYSTGTAGAILAGTATANQLLLSGSSTTPAWSTSTYPSTNAANTLLYASSANTMAALATGNNGVLITSGAGVPSISSTLPSAVQGNITATGALASGSLTTGFTAVTVPIGGTGNTTFTAYSLICAGTTATGTFQNVVGLGTAGYVLQSNGAGALPSWAPGGSSGGLLSFQIFTTGTAQTYTKPANVVNILVECLGAGGGGGGVSQVASSEAAGGGGAGGGYCRKWITGASATYTYTVGAGGAGGAAGANNGTSGAATTFSTLTANGGAFGSGQAASGAPQPSGGGGAGGTATGGDINITGMNGGSGFSLGGITGLALSGFGGSSQLGAGAPGNSTASAAPGLNAAANSGGGGSGAANSNTAQEAGGNGAAGIIIVWEFA